MTEPEPGSTRIVRVFLWRRTRLFAVKGMKRETRWLKHANIIETYQRMAYDSEPRWYRTRWAD